MNEKIELLMGNEAIGQGLIEAGCQLAAAYPGTPRLNPPAMIDRSDQALNHSISNGRSTKRSL